MFRVPICLPCIGILLLPYQFPIRNDHIYIYIYAKYILHKYCESGLIEWLFHFQCCRFSNAYHYMYNWKTYCNTFWCYIFKYDRYPVTFELYFLLTKEGSNVPLKWNILGNLSVWPNYYTNCYVFKNLGPWRVFGQNEIDIKWNNDENVKLVKLWMKDISFFLLKWHSTFIPWL